MACPLLPLRSHCVNPASQRLGTTTLPLLIDFPPKNFDFHLPVSHPGFRLQKSIPPSKYRPPQGSKLPLRQRTLTSLASALSLLDLSLPPLLSIPESRENSNQNYPCHTLQKITSNSSSDNYYASEIQSFDLHSMCLPNAHQASSYNPSVENQQPKLDPNQWLRSFVLILVFF